MRTKLYYADQNGNYTYLIYNKTSFFPETVNATLKSSFSMPCSYLAKPDYDYRMQSFKSS